MKFSRFCSALLALALMLALAQAALAATAPVTPQPSLIDQEALWGDWVTVREPTCTQPGLRQRRNVQGVVQQETIPALGHRYGPWVRISEASCVERAKEEHRCTVCGGGYEWQYAGELAPHQWGEWVTVRDGLRRRTCAVCGATEDEGSAASLPATQPGQDGLVLTAALEGDGPFSLGEQFSILVTVLNAGSEELLFKEASPSLDTLYPLSLKPGESRTLPSTLTVTQAMIDQAAQNDMRARVRYSAAYAAIAGWGTPLERPFSDIADVDVPLQGEPSSLPPGGVEPAAVKPDAEPTVEPEEVAEEPLPVISLSAALMEPQTYALNDYIAFALTLTNESDEALTFSYASHPVVEGWPETLAPHQQETLHYSYQVTEAHVNFAASHGGVFFEDVSAQYEDGFGTPAADTAECAVPLSANKNTYKLSLSAVIVDGSSEPYYADDIITIHLTAVNHSSVALDDVTLYDAYGMPVSSVSLAPGEPYSRDCTYTVLPEEADVGQIELSFDAVGWDLPNHKEVWAEPYPLTLDAAKAGSEVNPLLTLSYTGGPDGDLVLGSVIDLRITAHNEGNVWVKPYAFSPWPNDKVFYDQYSWGGEFISGLDPDQEGGFDYRIIVSPLDIGDGNVERSFSMGYYWVDEAEENHYLYTNVLKINYALEGEKRHAELTLTCVTAPAPGAGIGDEISAAMTLTNTGSVAVQLTDVVVEDYPGRSTDPLAADNLSEWAPYIFTTLEPGDPPITVTQKTTVIADDLAAGAVERTVVAHGVVVTDGSEDKPCESNKAHLSADLTSLPLLDPVDLFKARVGGPDNPAGYQESEMIHYQLTVKNVSGQTLTDLTLIDPVFKTEEASKLATKAALAPDEEWVFNFGYTVTAEDIASFQTLYNQASVRYREPGEQDESETYSNIVAAPLYAPPGLSLVKSFDFNPANGAYFTPGEVVTFHVTVSNPSGATLTGVSVTDPLFWNEETGCELGAYDTMPPHFTDTLSFAYTVTEPDASAAILNSANAAGSAGGEMITAISNTVEVPTGFPDGEPMVSIEKTETSTPASDTGMYRFNETITYDITVTNLFHEPLYVEVIDSLATDSGGVIAIIPALLPGVPYTVPFSYTVAMPDVINGTVENYAYADYYNANGYLGSVGFGPVVSLVGDGKKHLDSYAGDDSCRRIQTYQDDTQTTYALTLCADHLTVDSKAQAILDAAATGEDRISAARQVMALWQREASALYRALAAALPGQGATVMDSQRAFERYLSAWQAMLENDAAMDKATRLQRLTDLIEVRCVDLCEALHRLSGAEGAEVLASEAPAAADCGWLLSREADGRLTLRETLCANHSTIERFVRSHQESSADDLSTILAVGRLGWSNAMTALINARTVAADGDVKPVLSNCLAAARALLNSDATLWQAIYPDNPILCAGLTYNEARALTTMLDE